MVSNPRTVAATLVLVSSVIPAQIHAQGTAPSGQLPFADILFVEHGIVGASEYDGNALTDQFYGHNAALDGGLFLLKNFQSSNPQKVDIVAGLRVPLGSLNAGQELSRGTFLAPSLSYDGRTVVFAWSSGGTEKWLPKNRFHLFRVDIDGKNLEQLTDGDADDIHPAWMPNGRIVFVSTRGGGYSRNHGRPVPPFTLHSIKADGTDLIRLSYITANEFHPSIANDGRIVYSRQDNVDRDEIVANHLWLCNPDGSNPRSWGGNYPRPLDTMTGGPVSDGRLNGKRPLVEFYPRAIPGSTTKYVAVAGPHHGQAFGTLILRDYAKVDDNEMGQVTKLTPTIGMPETGDQTQGPLDARYATPWPLSETLHLASYNGSIVLLDTTAGTANQVVYYTTENKSLRPLYPIPVRAQTPPPAIPAATYQGERFCPEAPRATIQVDNVYNTDDYGKLPSSAKITALRIVQALPKTTPLSDYPKLGHSQGNIAKMAIGTVPVEEDGSVYCEAPIGKALLFQLLDENGMAVQTMRSATYVHPGEKLACLGCHEDKSNPPPAKSPLRATSRAPSKIEPELGRVEPVNFHRWIKPILQNKCTPCHVEKAAKPTDFSYANLADYVFWFSGRSGGINQPIHGGSRSKPGFIGARGSRMGKALQDSTHRKAQTDGVYTATDVRTLVQWLDLGSDELGAYEDTGAQGRGELVWPKLGVDKTDPQGLIYKPEGKHPETCPVSNPDGGAAGPSARSDAGLATDLQASTPEGAAGAGAALAMGGVSGNGGVPGAGAGGSPGYQGVESAGGAGGQSGSANSKASIARRSGGCSVGAGRRSDEASTVLILVVIPLMFGMRPLFTPSPRKCRGIHGKGHNHPRAGFGSRYSAAFATLWFLLACASCSSSQTVRNPNDAARTPEVGGPRPSWAETSRTDDANAAPDEIKSDAQPDSPPGNRSDALSEGLLRDASDGRDAAGEALPLPVDTGAADGGGMGVCTGEYSACGCPCCDSVGKDSNTLGCYYPTAGETLSAIKAANEKRYDPAVCGSPPLCNNVGMRYLCCLPAGPEVPSHVPDHATILMGGLEISKSGTDCAQFRFAPSRTSTRLGMRYHIETTAGWTLDRAAFGVCGATSAILPASGALGSLRVRASGDHCELDFHATLFFISNAGAIRTVRFDVDRLPVPNMPASQCP